MLLKFKPKEIRKRRPYTTRRRRVTPTALIVTGVVEVVPVEDDRHVTISFNTTEDVPLADASEAVGGKWTMRYQGVWYDGVGVSDNAFDQLTIVFVQSHAEVGEDEISYSNNPSDIGDVSGRMLAAFGPMEF